MKWLCCVLAAVLVAMALPVCAAVVTITPDPQPTDLPVGQVAVGETTCTNGWRIATNALGFGKICDFGPSTYQSRTGGFYAQYLDWYNDVWHPDTDFGRGAFMATCDEFKGTFPTISGDKTPSTVYLGTDTWMGTPIHGRELGSIGKLEYYSFCGKIPVRSIYLAAEGQQRDEQFWNWSNGWNGPQQPIQLHLVVESPDGSEIRQLWYRPWGYNYVGDDGMTEPGSQKGRWQWFNCMYARPGGEGKWYTPRCQDINYDPDAEEYGWASWGELIASSLKSMFPTDPSGDTPARVAQFSSWKVVDPVRLWKSPGWDGSTRPTGNISISTGTGLPLNFFLGARKSSVTPLFMDGQKTWVNGSYGARAQVDHFTLGFGGTDETYDFEPTATDPPMQTVAANCSMWNRVPGDPSIVWPDWQWRSGHPIAVSPGLAHQPMPLETTFYRTSLSMPTEPERGFLVKLTGKVALVPGNGQPAFTIDDGSPVQYQKLIANWGYNDKNEWVILSRDWGPFSSLERVDGVLMGGVRVHLPDDRLEDDRPCWAGDPLWIGPGDVVSVVGYVESPLFWSGAPMMWTNISLVQKVQNF